MAAQDQIDVIFTGKIQKIRPYELSVFQIILISVIWRVMREYNSPAGIRIGLDGRSDKFFVLAQLGRIHHIKNQKERIPSGKPVIAVSFVIAGAIGRQIGKGIMLRKLGASDLMISFQWSQRQAVEHSLIHECVVLFRIVIVIDLVA